MKECWINVYKYWLNTNSWYIFTGKDEFKTKEDAMRYFPSFGLSVAYHIHVRMK